MDFWWPKSADKMFKVANLPHMLKQYRKNCDECPCCYTGFFYGWGGFYLLQLRHEHVLDQVGGYVGGHGRQ